MELKDALATSLRRLLGRPTKDCAEFGLRPFKKPFPSCTQLTACPIAIKVQHRHGGLIGRAFVRSLSTAERFRERAILCGLFDVNRPSWRSSASLCSPTEADQRVFWAASAVV